MGPGIAQAVAFLLAFARASAPAGAAEPPKLFLRACAPCHGQDGKARTPQGRKLGVKDMTQSRLTEAQIRQQIRSGKTAPNGTVTMPAFEQTLTAEDIDLLARYATSLQVTRDKTKADR